MARKRFNQAERDVIHAAGMGGKVEVQNVTQWHAATLREPAVIQTNQWGWQYVTVTIDRTRGSVRAGDTWPATPGHIRAREA
jgi:hypothetical protein